MDVSEKEIILAEEQGASRKISSIKSLSGTLILTNLRLIFIRANSWFPSPPLMPGSGGSLRMPEIGFSEIYDVDDIHADTFGRSPDSLSFQIALIEDAHGGRGGITAHPSLEIHLAETSVLFHEETTGKRNQNLNDWADIIMRLKSGEFAQRIATEIERRMSEPPGETLAGKVLYILGDLQTKGVFEIWSELKARFEGYDLEFDLDSDKIEIACEDLFEHNWTAKITEGNMPPAYRKKPPLGEGFDLSS